MRAVLHSDLVEVSFKHLGPSGVVPMQPWPQKFVVSRSLLVSDAVEVRPLTIAGLAKGIGRNFVTINFWRLCWLLRGLGLLKTEEACLYRWRDLTLCFWRYQQIRRFRLVRKVLAAKARWLQ